MLKPKPENFERGIYWDRTWSPWIGCSPVSESCANCWARREEDARFRHLCRCGAPWDSTGDYVTPYFDRGPIYQGDDVLNAPRHWRKPQVIFAGFRTDLFHERIPINDIHEVLEVMDAPACRKHLFMVLTKRAENMARVCSGDVIPNVMLGVTVENQARADERLPHLAKLAAAGWKTLVSVEPMLGPVKMLDYLTVNPLAGAVIHHNRTGHTCGGVGDEFECRACGMGWKVGVDARPSFVVCGGESGKSARPMHPDWAQSLRDQCVAAGTPFWFKQWGEWWPAGKRILEKCERFGMFGNEAVYRVGKKRAGRVLDGRTWQEWPE